ncbi:MAG: bifunctional glutamate N-acetyltransferase/amino-acid acetyltransferase ArgJ [Rhodospirillaceae bacterium]|nr:bifunctional glutamate N-acetyltransferase/amino-acid acetyltransferase ArgJ [Rhodospirillaceae bacterium]
MTKLSPLAPEAFPVIPNISGVRMTSVACGVRYSGKLDLLFAEFDLDTQVAGVFTQSQTAAAPVQWCKQALLEGKARALVVNSGNANAFTGKSGENTVRLTAEYASEKVNSNSNEIFIASTGVIGEQLPHKKITDAMVNLDTKVNIDWRSAAEAICTTDTFPKGSYEKVMIGNSEVLIGGIAKGSGMIAPNMATMLAFIFTDASISSDILQILLKDSVEKSFNCITVDSDTSTSDTVLLFSTCKVKHQCIENHDQKELIEFKLGLDRVLLDLAHQIVCDGEGATKFIEINVSGADNHAAAKEIGFSIANSPLVKTAIAGEDANWGRIVMAVGKSGQKANRDALSISIGGVLIASDGQVVEGYDEMPVTQHMKGSSIVIDVDVGVNNGQSTVWTCDLTHGYIDINADYRT